jgi:hypothetical protein
MKLKSDQQSLEVFGDSDTIDFTIGDSNIILAFLRKNIYKNPIKVTIQEVLTNATDANIENNKKDCPIRIKLPNKLDPIFEVSDNGIGINPDRMKNVYTRFGVSTKRNSNNVQGAFGLGAKSPWSITDTFTIKTAWKDNDRIFYAEFAACLGENNSCKLLEIEKPREINGQTGTTISIPVNESEIQSFVDYTKQLVKFWKVKPDGLEVVSPDIEFESNEYVIYKEMIGPICLIEDIPYPIDSNLVKNSELLKRILPYLAIKIPIGTVDIAASRENLQYTPETTQYLTERLRKIRDDIIENAKQEVVNAPDLFTAIQNYKSVREKLAVDFDTDYHGKNLKDLVSIKINEGMAVPCYAVKEYGGKIKLKHKTNDWRGFHFEPLKDCLVINDSYNKVKERAEILFKTCGALYNDRMFILKPHVPSHADYKDLDKDERKRLMKEHLEANLKTFNDWLKASSLEEFIAYKLSDYEPEKVDKPKYDKNKFPIYKVHKDNTWRGSRYRYTRQDYTFSKIYVTKSDLDNFDYIHLEYTKKDDSLYRFRNYTKLWEKNKDKFIFAPAKTIPLLRKSQTPEQYAEKERNNIPKKLRNLQIVNRELEIKDLYYNLDTSVFAILKKVKKVIDSEYHKIDNLEHQFYDDKIKNTCDKINQLIEKRYTLINYIDLPYTTDPQRNVVLEQARLVVNQIDASDPLDLQSIEDEILGEII